MQNGDPFEADRMRDRFAILDAMSIVIERRQELMDVVTSAADRDAARREVIAPFEFSDVQALAVSDLQVRRFADGERRRIKEQAEEVRRKLG
jgi:DNA gyrase subunit A